MSNLSLSAHPPPSFPPSSSPRQAAKLAKAALDASDSEPLRLECTTVLARALHAQGRNGEAFRLYSQAATLDPRAPLPALGLGQLSLLRGELTNAASVLEGALTVVPAWTDALQVRGEVGYGMSYGSMLLNRVQAFALFIEKAGESVVKATRPPFSYEGELPSGK